MEGISETLSSSLQEWVESLCISLGHKASQIAYVHLYSATEEQVGNFLLMMACVFFSYF